MASNVCYIVDKEEEMRNPNSLSIAFVLTAWLIINIIRCICLSEYLYGQERDIKFECISLEQGLSQSSVYCILQDRKGFMWFGTEDGLNKYDGYEFTVYKPSPGAPHSLSNNYIFTLYEDREGVIWVGTRYGGVNKFDPAKEIFTPYQHDLNNPNSLSDDNISFIFEDQGGALWIGTRYGGLNRFDRDTKTFTRYQNDPDDSYSLSHNNAFCIHEDRSGVLWVGTGDGGLNKLVLPVPSYSGSEAEGLNPQKDRFIHYTHDPNNPHSLSHNTVAVIHEDESGIFWIGTWGGGLNKFDREKETFVHYKHDPNDPNSLSNDYVYKIYEDKSGVLWIGTFGGGLNKLVLPVPSSSGSEAEGFETKKETFTHYRNDPNDPNSLSNDQVLSIYEDRSSLLWIGTRGGGICKFDPSKRKFAHYQRNPDDPNSLSQNNIYAICDDLEEMGSVIWIGTRDRGLNKLVLSKAEGFNREKQTFTLYCHDPTNTNTLSLDNIYVIEKDRTGILWIGAYGGGLNKFDPENEIFTHYRNDPDDANSLSRDRIFAICQDKKGVLWIGTEDGGLNRFDPEKESFVCFKNDSDDPNSLADNTVRAIYESSIETDPILWIGTHGGLDKFDIKKSHFTHYRNDPTSLNSLSNNRVLSIHEDKSGTLWIGTGGGGLNKFDIEDETFRHYREKDGLPNEVIYGILEDDHGYLWLSTNNGLSKFNPRMETFKNYDVRDGLQSNEFNSGACYKSQSGEMFFGGINGFNVFHPDSIRDNLHIPPIVFTKFQIFNQSVKIGVDSPLQQNIADTKEITLSYKDDVFSFEFASLDYHIPERNHYAYMMEGFEDDWNYVGTRRFATYTNLDPGRYVFRVKGSNNDGVWNEDGVSLKIKIVPPFWRTWWFRIILVALVGGTIFGWYENRIRSIKVQRKKLEIQVAERTKELAAKTQELGELNATKDKFFSIVAHDLKGALQTQFSGSRLLADRIETLDKEMLKTIGEELKKNTSNLFKLLENLLQWSRIQTGRIEHQPSKIQLEDVVNDCINLLKGRAQEKGIRLSWDGIKDTSVHADPNMLNSVIQNLVSNAIKFSERGGTVRITSKVQDGFVELSVTDTGVGIEEEGLKNIFRIDKHHSTRGTEDEKGSGLGLILCKEFVEKNGGQIWVESKSGEGTTIRFTIPLTV